MKRMKIKFSGCETAVPIIEFTVGTSETLYGIVDSGSELTLFDYNKAKENKKHFKVKKPTQKINIVGLHSDANTPFLTADTEILVGKDQVLPLEGCVLYTLNHLNGHFEQDGESLRISAIIGSDTLDRLNAKIDYDKKELTYDLSCKQ